jgi:REP element-mobilizing transposase RayT
MARKLRLEYPGACYHVINRGNYRVDIFKTEGAKAAFETCLFEACAKSGWVLHAYVLMSNHYHLAVETPEGNLVAGMQWLQATFANRFNQLRGERGHLFQGRYKGLLVEEGGPLAQVCHYIHLNPVRAGVVTPVALDSYRYSSYWYLARPKQRPAFLQLGRTLREVGDLVDTPAGWKAYADFLAWQAAEGPAGKSKAYVSLSKGWALGSGEFKAALIQDHQLAATTRAWEGSGAQEIRELAWQRALNDALRARRKTVVDLTAARKGALWKVALAAELKQTTQARNAWLAEHLHMGRAEAVSSHVSKHRRKADTGAKRRV